MQSLETIKTKSQENLNRLVEMGKAQPTEVKTWGVTGGAAVIGAVTLAAIAQGVLAVLATLANPPVALAVGALAGGAIGWSLMQQPNDFSAGCRDAGCRDAGCRDAGCRDASCRDAGCGNATVERSRRSGLICGLICRCFTHLRGEGKDSPRPRQVNRHSG
jgi:hypothetical protein